LAFFFAAVVAALNARIESEQYGQVYPHVGSVLP
jgi:hypothetical protein